MLDALLLKARHELGLPLIHPARCRSCPSPLGRQYEEKYVEAIRLVGSKYLEAGDIPTAWAYFRAIGETERVARAILDYRPEGDDERLGAVIEVAFNHGVNPSAGIRADPRALRDLLGDHGLRAVAGPRRGGARRLRRAADPPPARRPVGQPPGRDRRAAASWSRRTGTSIAELIAGRDWLFADESYHIDISHLASVVRMSILRHRPRDDRAGRRPDRVRPPALAAAPVRGPPPFERIFDDHGIYLGALLGRDVEAAIAHFRAKLLAMRTRIGRGIAIPAQTLVNLLVRLGRLDEAIEVASQYLAGLPDSALSLPERRPALPACRRTRAAGGDRSRSERPGELHRRPPHAFPILNSFPSAPAPRIGRSQRAHGVGPCDRPIGDHLIHHSCGMSAGLEACGRHSAGMGRIGDAQG